jgi:uncharacterized membrane protein YoaK (UPF0700 family)
VSTFFTEVRETLFPRLDSKDGPLPPMLVAMTLVTGLVDSFSYLVLGHAFVANMTGNVVFLAFALAGAHGFSIGFSIVALSSFILGAFGLSLIRSRTGEQRGHLIATTAALEAILLGVSSAIAILSGNPMPTIYSYSLIIALAFSMGMQNAAARKLAVPDLTTTVLTLTITGLGADSRMGGGPGSKAGRRLTSISAMFIGALVGALMILYVSSSYALVMAFVVLTIVAVAARVLSRRYPSWVQSQSAITTKPSKEV